jgi:glycolate oxidase FAD binding subunit
MGDVSRRLVEQVKNAASTETGLNIVCRGTKEFMGRMPAGQAISVVEHSGIIEYLPVELVITARAGTSLEEIAATLDEHDQMLAFEPPTFAGRASIGGTLACNLSGPARPWSGGIRDSLLGLRIINGKGEHLKFGGKVMKNVAGYDVSRLQAGAMGSLGVITEVSLKVVPKPAARATVVQQMEIVEGIYTMNQAAGKHSSLSGACWLDEKVYLRFSGAQSAIDQATAKCSGDVLENGDEFWQALQEMRLDFFNRPGVLWRFSVKSTAVHFRGQADWLIDWAGALRWLRLPPDASDSGRASIERAGASASGQAMLFRGGDRSEEVFHTQKDVAKKIHRRLKSAFDPHGLFNRGRLYSWL